MQSEAHKGHLSSNVSHSDCCECRADTERRFVDRSVWRYEHVHVYLNYIAPPLAIIRSGERGHDARIWHRKLIDALHRRINLKVANRCHGRKWCDSYLERLGQFGKNVDAGYLRQFASRGASCLDR